MNKIQPQEQAVWDKLEGSQVQIKTFDNVSLLDLQNQLNDFLRSTISECEVLQILPITPGINFWATDSNTIKIDSNAVGGLNLSSERVWGIMVVYKVKK